MSWDIHSLVQLESDRHLDPSRPLESDPSRGPTLCGEQVASCQAGDLSTDRVWGARRFRQMPSCLTSVGRLLVRLHSDDSGQDTIEYAMLALLLALAAVIGERTIASSVNTVFITIGNKMSVPGV
jgi:pilus assembly protein Flp/PilA